MNLVAYVVKDAVPSYLQGVPIPRSFSGFTELSLKNWIHLISFSAVAGGLGYLAVKPYYERYYGGPKDEVINLTIKKDEPKATDIIDVEDLGEKTGFCRCWRSKKFPFCDGSHNAFNAKTGDNVASLVIRKGVKSR